jgi:ABC-type multidrug transport system ATPase subunit
VLKNVSFSIKTGEIKCLIGHNGAGKTTLVKILSGLVPADSGEISFGSNAT